MQNDHLNTTDVRLQRIRKISRILKICVLIYFLAPIYVIVLMRLWRPDTAYSTIKWGDHVYKNAGDVPAPMYAVIVICASIYFLGVLSFYRLLSLYEKGIIFSAANVLQMKRVGGSMVGYGIISFVSSIVHAGINLPSVDVRVGEQVWAPWIVIGAAINIIAWIMDEGRKIQEEQALTV